MDATTANLVSSIIQTIEQKKVTLTSVMDIISTSMELINEAKVPGAFKADIVTNVLQQIVGAQLSTFQPLLPAKIISDIQLLLDNNLVQPTINVIYAASTGQFNIGTVETCFSSWFSCLSKNA